MTGVQEDPMTTRSDRHKRPPLVTGGFEARLLPQEPVMRGVGGLTVWVRLDLGAGREWIAIGTVRTP